MLDRRKSCLLLTLLTFTVSMCIIVAGVGWIFQRLVLQETPSAAERNDVNANATSARPSFESFSTATANTNRPPSILKEVHYFGGGGGGGEPLCSPENSDRTMKGFDTFYVVPTTTGWRSQAIVFWSCGWNSVDTLSVKVDYPDGTGMLVSADVVHKAANDASTIEFNLGPNPPLGAYLVTVREPDKAITHSFNLIRPTNPRVYHLPGSVILWNFQPNERITLVAFKDDRSTRTLTFMAYKEFTADAHGELHISVDGQFDVFIAIGEYTGEVRQQDFFMMGSISSP